MKTKTWARFYFESQLYYGHVQTRHQWELIKEAYKGHDIDLLTAKIKPGTENEFGFYLEYDGDKTLRDFDNENNNQLTSEPEDVKEGE